MLDSRMLDLHMLDSHMLNSHMLYCVTSALNLTHASATGFLHCCESCNWASWPVLGGGAGTHSAGDTAQSEAEDYSSTEITGNLFGMTFLIQGRFSGGRPALIRRILGNSGEISNEVRDLRA
jgi:hypothetical protein